MSMHQTEHEAERPLEPYDGILLLSFGGPRAA